MIHIIGVSKSELIAVECNLLKNHVCSFMGSGEEVKHRAENIS